MADARYRRLSDRRFSFKFSTEFMGFPEKYGWRWRVPNTAGKTYDKVPNKGWVWHDLSHG